MAGREWLDKWTNSATGLYKKYIKEQEETIPKMLQLNTDPQLTAEGLADDTRSPIAQEFLDYFKGFYKEYTRTGSRVICNPPPLDTDDDYIILCKDEAQLDFLDECLTGEGFAPCGNSDQDYPNEKNNHSFEAYRKEDLNFIVTHDELYYRQFVRATKLSKKLNLLNKSDRVSVFKAVARNDWSEFEAVEKPKKAKYGLWNSGIISTNTTLNHVVQAGVGEVLFGNMLGGDNRLQAWQQVIIDDIVNPPVVRND